MDTDGTNQTNITNNLADDWEPCFSKGNTKFTFEPVSDENAKVYIKDSDRSKQIYITE
jgi:hypothetical protein